MEKEHALTKLMAKVCGINLMVLLAYSVAMYGSTARQQGGEMGFMASMMVMVAMHSGVCFIASIVFVIFKRTHFGLAFLLATLLVAVIGFSFCLAGAKGMNYYK